MDNSTTANPISGPTSGPYYAFIITYLVLLSMFGSFVNDMYIPTLPDMVKAFKCSISTVQLGLTSGMIGLGIGQMILGPLSDRYGRKPVLFVSLIVFAIGALFSVWSRSIEIFIFWRLIQGLGASGGYFLARTIPADMYQGRSLAKVMALVGAINGFAPASAPLIGGFVGKEIGWQGIFWILFALSLLLLILSFFLKESLTRDRRVKGRVVEAFKNYGYLFKKKSFMIHVLLKGSSLGMMFAYISSAPFIIQTHYGYDQVQFGLFMGFNALFAALGAMVSLKFHPLKNAMILGGRILFPIIVGQAICLYTVHNIWIYEIWNVLMIFCMGMLFSVSNTLSMNEGREYAGDASAILGFIGYVFGATLSPLVGLGNVLHSTAITLVVMSVVTLVFTRMSKLLPPDLDNPSSDTSGTSLPKAQANKNA